MLQKKQLKALIEQSYQKGDLMEEDVTKIAQALKRSELKQYIEALKKQEKSQTVVVTLPFPPTDEEKKTHAHMYQGKKIIYEIDPSLFLGARIRENDMITEYSLYDTLTSIQEYLEEEYDK